MSTARRSIRKDVAGAVSHRGLALAGGAVVTFAYLSILYRVVDVVGGVAGVSVFTAEIAGTLAVAAVLSRTLDPRRAVALGGALLAVGLLGYLATVPWAYFDLLQPVEDTVALLTGLSVLRMTRAGVWALGFTPGPLFVSWYFLLRREYASGAAVGGAALSLFVLTGDADAILGMVGVLGVVAALGFGRLDLEGGAVPQRNTLLAVLVAMVVVTTSVSLVPGGEARPLLGGDGASTVEGSLVDAGDQVNIQGSISLSPEVRFTVTAERSASWRVAAYDRYTGDGWVRTGRAAPYEGVLSRPPGEAERIRQTFEAESAVNTRPAAWKPYRVAAGADETLVTDMGGLQPTGTLSEGEQYSVESFAPEWTPSELRSAGTDYPAAVESRYLQLPESTPDRVEAFTARLTSNADTPYDTALIIERWLERNKEYSLDVSRPEGDFASSFIFEMDRGYCVYFATAMVTMLRSQGIPARFVVGYTSGQQVGENRWVVRGLDSHAWVEVYFPDVGWVEFDPTPSGPRQTVENERLQQARAAGDAGVDTDESRDAAGTPTPTPTETNGTPVPGRNQPGIAIQQGANASEDAGDVEPGDALTTSTETGANASGTGAGGAGGLPSRESVLYGLILFAGAATAIQRTGLLGRGYREIWLRRSPSGSPRERVEGAFERLEYLFERRFRPRRADETPREYVEAIEARYLDDRPTRLYEAYERAHYRGEATEEEAEAAWRLLDELLEERSRLRGRGVGLPSR